MPPDQMDGDTALLSGVAQGQEPALGRLIARHGARLAAIATRYLGNRAEAEDIVQETFVRVWQNAARFDPGRAKAATWITAITVRLCIDRHRRLKLRRLFWSDPVAEMDDLASDPAPLTEQALASRQELAATRKALAALPDRQRLAILLSAVGGLESAAIAEMLDISPGAVEQLLVRARRRLRELGLRA